ncbi:hypothetical protein ABZ436_13115 [Micromonospora matsumotoense]|uniref:hypothetical protein n=1 Tax=Micromonospora matsumotoense TaxID=121616 RepID=UPI0033FF7570
MTGDTVPRREVVGLAGLTLVALLAGCAGGAERRPSGGAGGPSTQGGGPPAVGGALIDRLADYRSAFRFTPTNSRAADGEVPAARARVAMRAELAAFLAWARTNGHPEIRPALPADVGDAGYLLDPLAGNDESLDAVPLAGAREPFGRLIPDNETVKSYVSTRQAGLALIMVKVMLSRAEYARLVTDSPLVRAAAGKNVVTVFPFTAPEPKAGDSYPELLPGVREAFRADSALRWLVANPGLSMSVENQQRLRDGGGTLYTADGYRVVYVDSARAGYLPAAVARALYDGLRAASG